MKLSIITINYNNAEGLRKTLASVAAQTYANIEHIIVDGGSTDGSVEIIREYADNQAKGERLKVKGIDECKVDSVRFKGVSECKVESVKCKGTENSKADTNASTPYTLHPTPTDSSTLYTLHLTPSAHIVRWISEPDKGIYNAMNKGLEIALGKRVVNDDHTSSPILNPSLNQPTPNPFLKEGEHASFAKTWGAHTADSTQYDLLKENAKANRKNPTEAESAMWDILKGNNIGYHFRRQHIILDYIVDFICLEKGLVIELDGGYHNNPEQKEYDERRTVHLQRLGYTELRFKNDELLCAPDSVIQKITETLEQLPSLQGGAGGRLSSLPFREGLGVGSLPSLKGRVGDRLIREGQGGGSHYIQILNSGDILAAPDVTERMMAALAAQCAEIKGDSLKIKGEETSEAEINAYNLSSINYKLNTPIFYGNMIKVNAQGKVVGKSGYTEYSLRQFYSSTLNHDCAYIRKDLFEKYGLYDEGLKIVSDWKWYLQAIGLGRAKPVYVDIDVTIFDDGGISETNLALRNKERRQVLEELLAPAVLWDYDTHAFEMEQMKRLRRWHLYGLVYFMERVCFKLEKWFRR